MGNEIVDGMGSPSAEEVAAEQEMNAKFNEKISQVIDDLNTDIPPVAMPDVEGSEDYQNALAKITPKMKEVDGSLGGIDVDAANAYRSGIADQKAAINANSASNAQARAETSAVNAQRYSDRTDAFREKHPVYQTPSGVMGGVDVDGYVDFRDQQRAGFEQWRDNLGPLARAGYNVVEGIADIIESGRINFDGQKNAIELGLNYGGQFTKGQGGGSTSITFDSNGQLSIALFGGEAGLDSSSDYNLNGSISLIKAYDVNSGGNLAFGTSEYTNLNIDLPGVILDKVLGKANFLKIKPSLGVSDISGYTHANGSVFSPREHSIEGFSVNLSGGYSQTPVSVSHSYQHSFSESAYTNYTLDLGLIGQAVYGVGNAIVGAVNYFTPASYNPAQGK